MSADDASTEATALRTRLEELIAAHDRADAVAAALEAVESGRIDLRSLHHEVLSPMLRDTGHEWQEGHTRVWEEHFTTATVRTIVEALYPHVQRMRAAAPVTGHSILLACPEDEAHDLGLRMLADMFDASGWTTFLLGADTPTVEIADAAAALGVDHVLLAAVTFIDRVRIRGVLDKLHERLPGVRLLVAGCEADCSERGLSDDEVFRAAEFFAAPGGPSYTED